MFFALLLSHPKLLATTLEFSTNDVSLGGSLGKVCSALKLHFPSFLKSTGSKGSNCQKGPASRPEVSGVENHLERGVVPQQLWAAILMGRMMGRVAAPSLEKPYQVRWQWPGCRTMVWATTHPCGWNRETPLALKFLHSPRTPASLPYF